MKKTIIFLVFVCFMISSVSALNVEFSCPANVNNNQEFECSVKLSSFSGNYDLKIDISQNGERVSKIWNINMWKSTNYYLENYIFNESERKARLIVNASSGEASGIIRLRKNGTVQYEKDFSVFILGGEDKKITDNQTIINETNNSSENIINLNPSVKEEIVYESNNEKIKKYAIYGFCGFLILLIIIILIKTWQDKKSEQ